MSLPLRKCDHHLVWSEGRTVLLNVRQSAAFLVPQSVVRALELVDGEHTAAQICTALAAEVGDEEAKRALAWCAANQFVYDEAEPPAPAPMGQAEETEPQVLFLMLTPGCDMACKYCYLTGTPFREQRVMSAAVARKAVDFLARGTHHPFYMVRFHGGEPTLCWSLIKETVLYAEAVFGREQKAVSFGLTTNAMHLTGEMIAFFREHAVAVNVSLDGPPEIHDRYRVGHKGEPTHAAVLKNLMSLQEQCASYTEVNSVLTPGVDLADLYQYLSGLGVSAWNPIPVQGKALGDTGDELSAADKAAYLSALDRLGHEILRCLERGERPMAIQTFTDYAKRLLYNQPFLTHCRAGWAELAVDAQGDLYACYELVGMPEYKVGNLDTGIEWPRLRSLLGELSVEQREPCRDCWARYLCGGGCWAYARLVAGSHQSPHPIFCAIHRGEVEITLVLVALAQEHAERTGDAFMLSNLVEPKLTEALEHSIEDAIGNGEGS